MHAGTLMLLYDVDQYIDYSRATDRIVQRTVRLPGEYWPWQRSVSRRGLIPFSKRSEVLGIDGH